MPSTPSSADASSLGEDTARRPSRRAVAILAAISVVVPCVLLAIVFAADRDDDPAPEAVAAAGCRRPLPDDEPSSTPTVPPSAEVGSGRAAVGEAAPDFDLLTLDRCERVQLSSMRGTPVVLTFFASWCHPCEEEMPLLEDAHDEMPDAFDVLAVTYDDLRPDAERFTSRLGVTYPALFDTGGVVVARYGVHGIPQTWFIDADGVVRYRVFGITTSVALDRPLDDLLDS